MFDAATKLLKANSKLASLLLVLVVLSVLATLVVPRLSQSGGAAGAPFYEGNPVETSMLDRQFKEPTPEDVLEQGRAEYDAKVAPRE